MQQDDFMEPRYVQPPRGLNKLRAAIAFCVTIIIVTGMILFFLHQSERFSIVTPSEGGIYVFDRKDHYLNHCTPDARCQTVILARGPMETAERMIEMMQQGQISMQLPGAAMAQNKMMQGQTMPGQMMQGQTAVTPMMLGEGSGKVAPTSVVQGSMQSGQVMANLSQMQNPAQGIMMAPSAPPFVVPPFVAQGQNAPANMMNPGGINTNNGNDDLNGGDDSGDDNSDNDDDSSDGDNVGDGDDF